MFATLEGTVDHTLERKREARRDRIHFLSEQRAQIDAEMTELVRAADDDGDWKAAGCTTSAQWLAHITRADYRNAARLARTSDALRSLPALDEALGSGTLTLDQVAAAAEFATPETDAQIAEVAVGKAPREIS